MENCFGQLVSCQGADYDSVDWDEGLDVEDTNAEERWFDDESGSESGHI